MSTGAGRVRRKVHIRVAYTGKGPPGPVLLGKCQELERALDGENIGTLGDFEAAGGTVSIYVSTTDPPRAVEVAWRHVNRLGLGSRTTIHTTTPSTKAAERGAQRGANDAG